MAEENNSDVKEVEKCVGTNPPVMSEEEIDKCVEPNTPVMSEEGSVGTVIIKDVEDVTSVVSSKGQEECTSETNEVPPKPQVANVRRHSTGTIGTRAGKLQVQSRYRGNHHVPSRHEHCKHGGNKRCDGQDNAVKVKPWKMARRKSVDEVSKVVKVETSSLTRKSLGSVTRQIPVITKPESSQAGKRDVLAVKKKPCASVKSESSSVKDESEMAKETRKKKETQSGSKNVSGLRNEKSNSAVKKVSRISDGESSKVSAPKNKEKAISGEDVKEKTVCVVESSVKGVKSEKQPTTMRSGHKSLNGSKQIPGTISSGLTKKKESVAEDLKGINTKPEKKIRAKKTGVKVTTPKQLSFKKGKTLELKPESSSPRWHKFRRRAVQEQKPQTEGRKKVLKEVVVTKSDACEGSKRAKVVLKHRKVEGKKKMVTLFNSVIEETYNKLTKVRKHKVKALIGAFETVISLQDAKTKPQSKATTSASQVSPLSSEQ
ncbi:unnamed protein product [Microthlaspi erraticum]|uniref:Calmodulin-binding domain-containing protein n=1 Tax=Microthlaspi erraticum TaxID=1685480 RepID=A0A6D2I381_9BRAS|nr:unnamed protein product [Microthlaspi erraticum]